jgi:hypothetical protein
MVQKKLVEAEERFGKAENDLEEAKKKNLKMQRQKCW